MQRVRSRQGGSAVTVLQSRPYDAAPELDGDLSVGDLIFLLESMRFDRRAPLQPVLIDEQVRTYTLAALRSRHPCSC